MNAYLSSKLFWDFFGLIVSLIAMVLTLRVLWRVEKRLHKFFKIFSWVIGIVVLRQILRILVHVEVLKDGPIFNILDALPPLIMIFALVVMNRLVEDLDGERR